MWIFLGLAVIFNLTSTTIRLSHDGIALSY